MIDRIWEWYCRNAGWILIGVFVLLDAFLLARVERLIR